MNHVSRWLTQFPNAMHLTREETITFLSNASLTKIVPTLLIVAFFVGCTTTKINSTADPTYLKTVNKMFILAQLPDRGWGTPQLLPNYPDSHEGYQENVRLFKATLENRFQKIGVASSCSLKTGVELDDDFYLKSMKSLDPDALLVIDFMSAITKRGVLAEVNYNLSLFDVATNKRFWRANLTVNVKSVIGGPRPTGDGMANDIFDALVAQLKHDKLDIFATLEPL